MDLVSLQEYKAALGLTKTEDDAKIEAAIGRISSIIKKYTQNTFADNFTVPLQEEFNVKFDGINSIFLSQSNIGSITVEMKNSDGTYSSLLSTDFHVDKINGILYRMPENLSWPVGVATVKCSYTCGYEEPPEDIKQATIELVKHYLKEEYKESKAIMSTSVSYNNQNKGGGVSKQYNFPSHIQIILDLYRF